MTIIGRSKKKITYHGRSGYPVIHQDERSGRKYYMVRKKDGGVKRKYI